MNTNGRESYQELTSDFTTVPRSFASRIIRPFGSAQGALSLSNGRNPQSSIRNRTIHDSPQQLL
jgi:hypothetical protein